RAPSSASEALRHVIEILNRDIEGILERLDTKEQNQFWFEVEHLEENRLRRESAVVGEEGFENVRSAVTGLDGRISEDERKLGEQDRRRFWELLRGAARQQWEETRQPKARHG
ncbi:MAG: hypothetical protein LAQ30_07825, partial [Acidobacteriia bacterium]|nr:hypothetical protein [Terriglobia bacterium]